MFNYKYTITTVTRYFLRVSPLREQPLTHARNASAANFDSAGLYRISRPNRNQNDVFSLFIRSDVRRFVRVLYARARARTSAAPALMIGSPLTLPLPLRFPFSKV